MIKGYMDFTIQNRILVLAITLFLCGAGIYQYQKLPVDAFPDISPIMVPIFAEAHGMAPEEVERLITFPIESKMNGLPGVRQIKSTSAFGMAVIYVYFEDDIDIYFARQIVNERLNNALAELPAMHEPPKLGPISTGLGQIFIYYLTIDGNVDTGGKSSLNYLREVNDWVVKYQLQTVKGVTDILSMGGHVLQYQLRVNPFALQKYGISLEDVVAKIKNNNKNAGGQFLVLGQEEFLVRGLGLLKDLEEIRNITLKARNGIPVRISDIATVDFGNEIRRGVVSLNGEKEVVSGIVIQLYGENTSRVIKQLYKKIVKIQASLPAGIKLVPYYEQANLVLAATWTVKDAILKGAGLVVLILFLFLGNFQSAFIVALSLPVCALIAVLFMSYFNVSANLMSLGGLAIAIGMLGDGTIVMVENIFRKLKEERLWGFYQTISQAGCEVVKPILFSILIIILVFLPIYTLEDVEGKMFSPLAFTLTSALFGSIFMALIVTPALASIFLDQDEKKEFFFVNWLKEFYRPLLSLAVRYKKTVLLIALGCFFSSLALIPSIGTEFIPKLEEGSTLIGVTMAPSISLVQATSLIQNLERKIIKFPGVHKILSRIGRPEAGSHPHPVNYAEIHIELDNRLLAEKNLSKLDLEGQIRDELSTYPGIQLNFTQPIQNAFDELLSGIKAQLAIKVFGEDLAVIRKTATEISMAIDNIPGLVDLATEQSAGQPQVQIAVNRKACARLGIEAAQVLELVELAVGGEVIDNIYLGTRRFGIHIRYHEAYRKKPEYLKRLLLHTSDGSLISLGKVADVKLVLGPIQINRENNSRRWVIQANIKDRDLGSVFSDIRQRIKERIKLPTGIFLEYGGQFENQRRAMTRLSIIIPFVIILIFLLLGLSFASWKNALLIFFTIPFSVTGGIIGLFFTGEYLSVPAIVGFIALFGIGVQNGMVLVSCINSLLEQGMAEEQAVIDGSLLRLRPILMTAATTIMGLLPLLFSTGIGAEVQRPLAIVVVFGLSTACFLTLFIIPSFFSWFRASKVFKVPTSYT
ncbi:efflux RND transporter permease subunit [Candidatus Riflebacteria bacterium]